jgi:hypothetical protein
MAARQHAPSFTYHPLGGGEQPLSRHVRLAWQRSTRRARGADEALLRALVEPHGVVVHLRSALEEGKAYVTYADPAQAAAAVAALHGTAVGALKGLRVEARLWGGAEVAATAPSVVVDAGGVGSGEAAAAAASVAALFPALPLSVPTATVPPIRGLTLIHDFLSEGEEARLLEWLLHCSSGSSSSGSGSGDDDNDAAGSGGGGSAWVGSGHLARRVQHFGTRFDYVTRTLTTTTTTTTASAGSAPAAAAAADATATAAPIARVQDVPADGPLHALAARVAALGVLGDDGYHGWNHCAGGAPVPLARLLLPRPSNGASTADADDTHAPAQAALLAALVSACDDAGLGDAGAGGGSFSCGCTSKCGAGGGCMADAARSYALSDQITVNEYRPGQGIGAHVDTHAGFQDGIVSVSLGCGTVMDFVRSAPTPPADPAAAAAAGAVEGRVVDLAAVAGAAAAGGGEGASSTPAAPQEASPSLAAVGSRASVYLPRRSLLLLRGEARHAWTHGIASRRVDVLDGVATPRVGNRVSVTLRRARRVDGTTTAATGAGNTAAAAAADVTPPTPPPPPTPCTCVWPSVCFDQSGEPSRPAVLRSPRLQRLAAAMPDGAAPAQLPSFAVTAADAAAAATTGVAAASTAVAPAAAQSPLPSPQAPSTGLLPLAPGAPLPPDIEARHVHCLYDAIAEHFSHTRHSPWPRVQAFLRSLPPGSVVVDVGCGNGKYMGLRPDVLTVGCDRSPPLAEIAGRRGHNAAVGDALAPPFRPGVADAALSIAVLHHISTRARRVALLAALLRCVRPAGGRLFVQAWAAEQGPDSRRDFSGGSDALVPWCLARR